MVNFSMLMGLNRLCNQNLCKHIKLRRNRQNNFNYHYLILGSLNAVNKRAWELSVGDVERVQTKLKEEEKYQIQVQKRPFNAYKTIM